jgi:hypothetical protein
MKKTMLLAGAVALSFAAAPAFAETLSTPSELAQTRALNSGAQTGTYVTADALNGQTNPTEPNGIPDPPFGRPAQPNAFGPQGNALPPAMEHKPAPASDDFIALETVDPNRLEGAEVQSADGTAIGRVREVTLGSDGAPSEVAVELNDGHDISVPQDVLKFNPMNNVVLSSMDMNQMVAFGDDNAARHDAGTGDRQAHGPGDNSVSIGRSPEGSAPEGAQP